MSQKMFVNYLPFSDLTHQEILESQIIIGAKAFKEQTATFIDRK